MDNLDSLFNTEPSNENDSITPGDAIGDPLFSKALEKDGDFLPKVELNNQQQQQPQTQQPNELEYYKAEAERMKSELESAKEEMAGLSALRQELENNPELLSKLEEYYNGGGQQTTAPTQQPTQITPPEEFSPYDIANPATPSGQYFRNMLAGILKETVQPEIQQVKQYVQQTVGTVEQQVTAERQLREMRQQLSEVPEQEFNQFVQWSMSKKPTVQDLYKLYALQQGKVSTQQQPRGVVPNVSGVSSQSRGTDNVAAKRMIDTILQTGNQGLF